MINSAQVILPIEFIRAELYCQITGESMEAIYGHIRERWKIIIRLSKVRYRNPYQTRHTFASTLLMNGEPELLVAQLLGHTTVEMVRRHYGRFIKQPEGIKLKSDYSEFGANLGQQANKKTA